MLSGGIFLTRVSTRGQQGIDVLIGFQFLQPSFFAVNVIEGGILPEDGDRGVGIRNTRCRPML